MQIKRRPSSKLRSLLLSKACIAGYLLGCTIGVVRVLCLLREVEDIPRSTMLTDIAFGQSLSSEYASFQEQGNRSSRFPSVDDRVKTYMGRWYVPPCDESNKIPYRFIDSTIEGKSERLVLLRELPKVNGTEKRVFVVPNHVQSARAIYLKRQAFEGCKSGYCLDTKKYIIPTLDRLDSQSSAHRDTTPIVLQYVC